MTPYSLSDLSDHALLHALATIVSRERSTTAALLAHIGEADERKLYLPAAHDSMYAYCVRELHMSEDMAYKRIQAARAARRFPAILPAVAEGRLHLTGVVLLAPHLTPGTAGELLPAAFHKTKAEIEMLLAERFPRPDVPALLQAAGPVLRHDEQAVQPADGSRLELVPEPVPSIWANGPARMEPLPSRAKLAPLSAERYALQVTLDKDTYEQLRYAQALLGHAVPSGDVAQVIERALVSLVRDLEKRKFARCSRPRSQGGAASGRHIPAAVKRAVLERDGGRCAFVSQAGRRCESRTRLEFDHVEPVARGGRATVAGIRLRCRAHNQYAADCAFGPEFMRRKRHGGRRGSATVRLPAAAPVEHAEARSQSAAEAASREEVVPWLRTLGCNLETARRAAARCEGMVGAQLEDRVRAALKSLGPPGARRVLPVTSSRG